MLSAFFLVTVLNFNQHLFSQEKKGAVIIQYDMKEEIGPSTWRATKQAFQRAKAENAAAIIVHMNTYGGLLESADSIRTKFLASDIPIYVFIDPNAASAGALISVSCNKIYMSKSATIGAATVVTQTGEAAPDKYQSYMRGIMRATAQARGRNPEIAEAMVDENLEVDSISPKGQVITFTTEEAMKYGFCDGEVSSVYDVLKAEGYVNYNLIELHPTFLDRVINFLISPFVSGILILIMLGGIYFELQTPGVGFPLAAAVAAALLYFAPLYLEDLAANWEILLFIAGLVLLGLEVFVIPGFGIAGFAGISFILISLILSMVRNDFFDFSFTGWKPLMTAMLTVFGSVAAGIVIIVVTGRSIIGSKHFQRLVLQDTLGSYNQNTEAPNGESQEQHIGLVGKTGEAFTDLYPSGKVMIDNEIYDAMTEGMYLDKGTKVKVVQDLRSKIIVRKTES